MVLTILSAFFFGCSNSMNKLINSPINIHGNNTNNILNGGLVAQQGEWVYYYYPGNIFGIGEGLYKSKRDGSKKEKIISGNVSNINVIGEWIYYVISEGSPIEQQNLFKVKTNGSENILIQENCSNINAIKDRIFYSVFVDDIKYQKEAISDYPYKGENGNIYSMGVDGNKKVKLVSKNTYGFLISSGSIFYSDGNGIYKTDLYGRNEIKILSGRVTDYVVNNNYLYYVENEKIIRMNLLTKNSKIITTSSRRILTFIPYKNNIFFITNDSMLHKINNDGSNIKDIRNGLISIFSFDNVLYGWSTKGEKIEIID